jgi:hypothetical protein
VVNRLNDLYSMNCRDIEPLLLAERDGVLTASQHASLGQHVAACPACRQMRVDLSAAMSALRTDAANVTVPDVDTEWHALQARLNDTVTVRPEKKRPLAPVIRFGAPLAAAAAIAFAFFTLQTPNPKSEIPLEVASADYVEAGNADASTVVYVDKESGWLVVWATDEEAEHSI